MFPRIPRHNLRQVQPLVKAFAEKNGLDFHSYTFTRANGLVLGVMQDVANQIGAVLAADKSHIH
jgi:delta8-fatty-acid desaturase